MNTTSSSSEPNEPYVSCIKVDGTPILPPLMNNVKRAEMAAYRQLAIEREHWRKIGGTGMKNTGTGLQQAGRVSTFISTPPKSSSPSASKYENIYLTSTPKPNVDLGVLGKKKEENDQVQSLRGQGNDVMNFVESFQKDEMEHGQSEDGSSSDSAAGNFASGPSSTGTFIINKSGQEIQDADKSEGEVEDLLDEEEELGDGHNESLSGNSQTVIRRPSFNTTETTDLVSKRKRPARYFDNNDDEDKDQDSTEENEKGVEKINLNVSSEDDNTCTFRTGGTSSTSLSKYITSCTPTFTPIPNLIPIPPLPNTVALNHQMIESTPTVKRSPITFTINTNFAEAALATTPPRSTKSGVRRSSASKSRKSLSFTTPERIGTMKATDPDFDFVLTTDIPRSAEKNRPIPFGDEDSCSSDCSDKENHGAGHGIKNHVRQLSYTLLTPSAELLAAAGMDPSMLPAIPSAPSSFASAQSSPIKDKGNADDEAGSSEMQITVSKLQQLHLEKGKKAHLERYLFESDKNNPTGVSKSADGERITELQDVISRIEMQHQKQLESLMKDYRKQAQTIREEFEKEKNKVLMELNISPTPSLKIDQSQNFDTFVSQPCNLASSSSILMDTSNLRNYYITNETSTQDSRLGQTTGAKNNNVTNSARSMISSEASCIHSIPPSPTAIVKQEKMSTVGLSKFQNKMQKINPTLLKHSVDIRSPLLKGLVFPDPLERSSGVWKIPPQAHDAAMKPKFDKLTAVVKGYLTRRLLHTQKIQIIIQTIRDTVNLLLNLYEENPPSDQGLIEIKQEDLGLHHRLVQQLIGACSAFNDIFFKISVKERMAIIANDREKIRAKALKNVLGRRAGTSPSKHAISSATLRSMERRQTQSRSPGKKDNQSEARFKRPTLRPTLKPTNSGNPPSGSQTVKPKGVKSYNLSPKRRRMSFWGAAGASDKKSKMTRISSAKSGNLNENKGIPHRPNTAMPVRNADKNPMPRLTSTSSSAELNTNAIGWGSDTFLVPSDARAVHPSHQNQTSFSTKPSKRPSTNRSVGLPTNANRTTRMSTSTNRIPWKE